MGGKDDISKMKLKCDLLCWHNMCCGDVQLKVEGLARSNLQDVEQDVGSLQQNEGWARGGGF